MTSKGQETSGKIGQLLKAEYQRGYSIAKEEARLLAEKVKKQHEKYIHDLNLKHKRNLMDLYHLGLEVQTHNTLCRPRQRLNMLQLAVMKGMIKIVTLLIQDLHVDVDEIPDPISTLKQFSGTDILGGNRNSMTKSNNRSQGTRPKIRDDKSKSKSKSKSTKSKSKQTKRLNIDSDDGINDENEMKWSKFLANIEKDKIQKVILSTSNDGSSSSSSSSSSSGGGGGSKGWWNAMVDDDFDELFVEQNKTLQMIYTLEGRLRLEENTSSIGNTGNTGSSNRRIKNDGNIRGYAEVSDGVHNPITTLVPVLSGLTSSGKTFVTRATDGLLDINLVVFLLQHGVDIEIDGEGYALQLAQLEMDHIEQTKKAVTLGFNQSMTTRSYDFLNNNNNNNNNNSNSNSSNSNNGSNNNSHNDSSHMILDAISTVYRTRMNLLQKRCESQSERAIFIAIRRGHLEITKLLLEAGADVDAPNAQSLSPLCLACNLHATSIVALLLQCGASVKPTPIQIKTNINDNHHDTYNKNNGRSKYNDSQYHYKYNKDQYSNNSNNNKYNSTSTSSSMLANAFHPTAPNVQDPLYCVIAASKDYYSKESGLVIVKMLLQHGALKYHHTELVKTIIAALTASNTGNTGNNNNNNTNTTTNSYYNNDDNIRL